MKMKIGVTGSKGRIGSRLVALGAVPLEFDVTDREAAMRGLDHLRPNVVVHAASISSIARCEEDLDLAITVNSWGTNTVCEAADRVGAKVVFLSSEQVFDGIKGCYSETDEPNPINDYGRTKFGAEGIVNQLYGGKTIRLSRGISRESGKDIDIYINDLGMEKEIHVPDFIKRSYSHLDFLAEGVWEFAKNFESMPDLVHLGGTVAISFHHLMLIIAEELDLDSSLVLPRTTQIKEHPRPLNCGFDVSLAEKSGLPVAPIYNSIERLAEEYARL